ncbi:MAG: peptidylprolyl isomerase [Candidatus Hydrogenedentes bacterium]|nr:peptidylprolyl isomerase [Candidatus Hydrogenedentota bacterium]
MEDHRRRTQAAHGDTVRVHYRGTTNDGAEFDSSYDREPLEFRLGAGQVIPGFERAVEGMTAGEKKTETMPAAEAYGPHREEMVMEVPRTQLPEDLEVQVGTQLQASQPGEAPVLLTVTAVDTDTITVDANHPLAGEDLTFEIELVEIVS